MGLILVLYTWWFPPQPQDPSVAPSTTQDRSNPGPQHNRAGSLDTLTATASSADNLPDSVLDRSPFGPWTRGTEVVHVLQNQDIKLQFTSKGGQLQQASLLGFRTYKGLPLNLFDSLGQMQGYALLTPQKVWSSGDFYFKPREATPRSLTYALDLGQGRQILHRYRLDSSGYRLRFSIQFVGMDSLLQNDYTTMQWAATGPSQERDVREERKSMEMYYRYTNDEPDYMSMGSSSEEDLNNNVQWISFRQKFFCAVLGAEKHFDRARIKGEPSEAADRTGRYQAELTLDHRAGSTDPFEMWMYLGPNHFQTLKAQDQGLEKQVPLGWGIFGWVNRFLVIPVFNWLDTFGWNYGLIILVLTLIIKILLFPLSYQSLISGAKMKVLKPEVEELKSKFEKDPTRMQSEQMKLFQRAGVNPLGGCLPMLMQLPILIALFNFFPASIELRQQRFLWADDLSSYDSILDLPFEIPFYGAHVSLFTLLMTASTLLYTRISNQMSGVTGQMKVMGYVMPLMFIPVLNTYSAALSYYYFLANMVSFGQQWLVRRFLIDEAALLRKIEDNKKKPLKKSSFQQKLEDLAKKAKENRPAPAGPRRTK